VRTLLLIPIVAAALLVLPASAFAFSLNQNPMSR